MNKKTSIRSSCLSVLAFPRGRRLQEGRRRPAPRAPRGAAARPVQDHLPGRNPDVELSSLIYTVNAVGSVDAFEKVQVTARVSGVVDRVLFSEGSFAKVDQVLVEIEPERYKLAVEAAQAAYEKAVASLADAEAGLKRRESVINQNPGLIPGEEVETWRTRCPWPSPTSPRRRPPSTRPSSTSMTPTSGRPFSGILQTRTVQTGEYVETGTVLATLVRRDPLLLRFKVPERDAARLELGMKANFKVRNDATWNSARRSSTSPSPPTTRPGSSPSPPRSRTPEDEPLRPGSFAEIIVPVSSERTAPVIPQTAIRPSDRGFIAFVVENDAAEERILPLGMRTADGQVEVLSRAQGRREARHPRRRGPARRGARPEPVPATPKPAPDARPRRNEAKAEPGGPP